MLAAGLLLLSAPVIGVLCLLVRVNLGSPVLFRQERAGRGGRPFTILKLRTMTEERNHSGAMLPDSERLTRLGRFLRTTGLDELPQLWNVLRGDMSLVGPRPLPTRYLDRYSAQQARRHEVRPGITGWAQINGRNDLEWPEQLKLDVWYVDHRSVRLDAMILWRSLLVLFRTPVAAEGAPRPEFQGVGDTMPSEARARTPRD